MHEIGLQLITRRSKVRILPPLLRKTPVSREENGVFYLSVIVVYCSLIPFIDVYLVTFLVTFWLRFAFSGIPYTGILSTNSFARSKFGMVYIFVVSLDE